MGAVGTTTMTRGGVYFWCNVVDVDVQEKLEVKNLLCEVGLSTRGVIDECHCIAAHTGTLVVHAFICTEHDDNVCFEV